MCQLLGVSRANIYKFKEKKLQEDPYTQRVINIFRDNRQAYGTRRIKAAGARIGIVISRRRIARIMKENALISVYTVAQYKPTKSAPNEAKTENVVNREFNQRDPFEAIVSDLTYVRVGSRWHYVCKLLDLHNRKIIGYSCGPHKTAELVLKAFASVKENLQKLHLFHTDRGSDFKNHTIDNLLEEFNIQRSLSRKGSPYDNAVAEATFKTIKMELIYQTRFETLNDLKREMGAFVWWYNHQRLHSTLGYMPPVEYAEKLSL